MKKFLEKLFAVVMAVAMVAGCVVACQPQEEPTEAVTYDVVIWVSEVEGVKELTQKQVDAFNAANTDIKINATIEGVSEGDAATKMIADVETGADLYCFAQDQLARLIEAGAITKLGDKTAEKVKAENTAGSIKNASFGDVLYAFPLTDDNGYFMYYDKSVIPEADVDSLEKLIEDCENAGKLFSFQLEGSAWYAASFFFGAGCVSDWTTGDDGEFISVNDTFDSELGLIAAEGIQKLVKSTCFRDSSTASDFSAATPSAIVVSGTWDYTTAKAALGDNFGVADLPSFTVDGKEYHLGSFNGCKMMGMKPQTDSAKASAIQRLAYYLAGETCQLERFTEFGWGPSNSVALNNESVASNPTLLALGAQNAYAQPQGQIHGSWWDIAKLIATNLKAADETTEGRQSALTAYHEAVDALFAMSEEEKTAFSVIGTIVGTNWDTDFSMTKTENADGTQTWVSEALELVANDEFKCRQGGSWTLAIGDNGNNYVVAEAGTYVVQLVYNPADETGTITLIKQ